MHIRYRVELEESERQHLEAIVAGGTRAVRRVKRAQILLAAAAGASDAEIAATEHVGHLDGISDQAALRRAWIGPRPAEGPRPSGKRKLLATEEALLIATACAQPPAGRARWTLAFLASEVVRLTAHTSISRATIGRRLAENDLKPWQEKMWCVPQIDARTSRAWRMCSASTRRSRVPALPSSVSTKRRSNSLAKSGPRCRRPPDIPRATTTSTNGTARRMSLSRSIAHQPRRYTNVTARRTAVDFAEWLCDLVDLHYAGTERIRSSSTICRPTRQRRSTRRFRPPKLAACASRLE